MNRDFAGLCAEHVAFDAYKVTDVKQFLEHHIVEVFVFARTDFVAVHIDLDAAFGVLKFKKRGFAHDAAAHDSACYGHIAAGGFVCKSFFNFVGVAADRKFGCREGVYATATHFVKTASTYDLLFTEFKDIHILMILILFAYIY